jgi:hypothetical protein
MLLTGVVGCGTESSTLGEVLLPPSLPPVSTPSEPNLARVRVRDGAGAIILDSLFTIPEPPAFRAPLSAQDSLEMRYFAYHLLTPMDTNTVLAFVLAGDTLFSKQYSRFTAGQSSHSGILFSDSILMNTDYRTPDTVKVFGKLHGTTMASVEFEAVGIQGGASLRGLLSRVAMEQTSCTTLIAAFVSELGLMGVALAETYGTASFAWIAGFGGVGVLAILAGLNEEGCWGDFLEWLGGGEPPTYRLTYNGCTGSFTPTNLRKARPALFELVNTKSWVCS